MSKHQWNPQLQFQGMPHDSNLNSCEYWTCQCAARTSIIRKYLFTKWMPEHGTARDAQFCLGPMSFAKILSIQCISVNSDWLFSQCIWSVTQKKSYGAVNKRMQGTASTSSPLVTLLVFCIDLLSGSCIPFFTGFQQCFGSFNDTGPPKSYMSTTSTCIEHS